MKIATLILILLATFARAASPLTINDGNSAVALGSNAWFSSLVNVRPGNNETVSNPPIFSWFAHTNHLEGGEMNANGFLYTIYEQTNSYRLRIHTNMTTPVSSVSFNITKLGISHFIMVVHAHMPLAAVARADSAEGAYAYDWMLNFLLARGSSYYLTTGGSVVSSTYNIGPSPDTTSYHNIVGTYDGANQRLYFDGVLRDTDANTGAFADNARPITLGSTEDNQGPFNGRMKDFRIYAARVLNDSEVAALYAAGPNP